MSLADPPADRQAASDTSCGWEFAVHLAGDVLLETPHDVLLGAARFCSAMPSLHVAWAVWVALAVVVAFPSSRVRHLAWTYPVMTTLVVMATGHHFLTDAVAAAPLVWAAWSVSLALGAGGRRDEHRWPDLALSSPQNFVDAPPLQPHPRPGTPGIEHVSPVSH